MDKAPLNLMIKGTPNSVRIVSLEFFDVELRLDGIVWLK
jgi:hypothetical protein